MGIEVGHHALDGGIDQLAVLDRAHIVGAHPFKRVAEQIELAIGGRVIGALGFGQRDHGGGETAHQSQANQCKLLHVLSAFTSCPTYVLFVLPNAGRKLILSQGVGFCPWPP